MILSNEVPRIKDASAALASRFLVVLFRRNFLGHENIRLFDKLVPELPGILLWAIEGIQRLRPRGHFVQPATGADVLTQMEDLASPVLAFVRDCCVVGAGHRVEVDVLYRAWRCWCSGVGRDEPGPKRSFGRDLNAAVPGTKIRRGTDNVRFYEGIDLNGGHS